MTAANPSAALHALDADGVWVVGGAVRDALSGAEPDRRDLDLAAADAGRWSRQAADALGAPVLKLSASYGIWRIFLPDGQIDIWDLADSDIEADLQRRDFTINAMAVPLEHFRASGVARALIDPLGGLADIRARRLRLVSEQALQSDPLRLLRAVRLEAEGGWRPDARLCRAMDRDAALIVRSAPERQWAELQRIMLSDRLPWALRRMERSGLLDALFPELTAGRGVDQRPAHRRDVFWHQIDAVHWLTRLTSEERPRSARAAALWQELQPLRAVSQIRAALDAWRLPLRLAVLLHDIGKPQTKTVGADGSTHFFGHSELGAELAGGCLRRLRAPVRTLDQVVLLIAQHLRPGQLNAPGRPPTERALHRFHRALGEAAAPLCWLFLADSLAAAGADVLLPRWPAYAAHAARILAWQPQRPTQTGRLLDGHAIMEATGLEPGPLVGQIRAKLDEAAAIGEITGVDEARSLAVRLAADMPAAATV